MPDQSTPPLTPRRLRMPSQRFVAKTRARSGPLNCWMFTGWCDKQGYGRFFDGARMVLAHHFAWESVSSIPLPAGMHALHTCDTPSCVRNDEPGTYLLNGIEHPRWGHLWLGTNADNVADKVAKGRQARGSQHGAAVSAAVPHGEQHARARLSAAQVLEMCRLSDQEGVSNYELARRFGIGRNTAWCIIRGITWIEVTGRNYGAAH